jgi:hypothetical protein
MSSPGRSARYGELTRSAPWANRKTGTDGAARRIIDLHILLDCELRVRCGCCQLRGRENPSDFRMAARSWSVHELLKSIDEREEARADPRARDQSSMCHRTASGQTRLGPRLKLTIRCDGTLMFALRSSKVSITSITMSDAPASQSPDPCDWLPSLANSRTAIDAMRDMCGRGTLPMRKPPRWSHPH